MDDPEQTAPESYSQDSGAGAAVVKWLKETAELCDGISPCQSVREGSLGAGLLTMLIFSAESRCVGGELDRSYRRRRRALCFKGGGDVRRLSRADGLLNMLVRRYSRCTCKYSAMTQPSTKNKAQHQLSSLPCGDVFSQ